MANRQRCIRGEALACAAMASSVWPAGQRHWHHPTCRQAPGKPQRCRQPALPLGPCTPAHLPATHLHTCTRLQVTDFLGAAAFSRAVQATDIQTGSLVCLKIIKNNKDYLDQSLDEIKLLKYVNDADPLDEHGIVRLYDFFYYKVRHARAQPRGLARQQAPRR
jgi:hypothetical protein